MNVTIDGGQILQGIAAILLVLLPWLSLRASQKNADNLQKVDDKVADTKVVLGQIEKTTNSLSERNEAIAKKLGIEQGRALGRADHKAELAEKALALKENEHPNGTTLDHIPNRPVK